MITPTDESKLAEVPAMADDPHQSPLTDPRALPFLPMLYVAWADGDLADEEVGEICSRVSATPDLEGGCRKLLGHWLDPSHPPSARDLRRLLTIIQRGAAGLPSTDKLSLVDLGVELARADGHEVLPAERMALEEIGNVLGLSPAEVAPLLLVEQRPAAEVPEPPPSFAVDAMTRLLDGGHFELRAKLKNLLAEQRFSRRHDLGRAAYRQKVLEWCQILADHGIGGLSFPTEYGGAGDMGASIAAAQVLGFHDLSLFVKYGVQFGLFAGSVYQLGSEKHHRLFLEDAAKLRLPGCFAMTETGHGSNVADAETSAHFNRERDEFVVHTPHAGARKDYIGNAALHGRMATVFAQLIIDDETYGVHAFVVPIRDDSGAPLPGVSIEDCGHKLGLNGVDNGRLTFDQVRVPRENLLDRFAGVDRDGNYTSPIASPSKRFFTMLGTLVGGRVTVACVSLSAAKSALAIAVRYGAGRRQFGPPGKPETVILDYLTHQRRLMPRLAATYAFNFALRHLADQFVASGSEEDRRNVEGLAAGLKALATWHASDTIQTCREACGGNGYLAVNRFADLKADSDIFTTFEGDNTVLLQLLAKSLLTGFKRQFEGMNALGLLRYLAGRTGDVLGEYVHKHVVTEEGLRDRDFQLDALKFREEHLLGSVARRLKKRVDRGLSGFDALIECQDHLVTTAKAHVERVVFEQFAAATHADDPKLAEALSSLCDLYALWRIESDRGWFLEQGYFDHASAKAIRHAVNELCRETRRDAIALVDAFGIPEELLGAPIARTSR